MKKAVAVFVFLMLAGCTSNSIYQYGEFDPSQKTIGVVREDDRAMPLKQILQNDGWTLFVTQLAERKNSNTPDSISGMYISTPRYRLVTSFEHDDICLLTFDPAYYREGMIVNEGKIYDPMYYYNVAIIDNQTNQPVMLMEGYNCRRNILHQFVDALKGRAHQQDNNYNN